MFDFKDVIEVVCRSLQKACCQSLIGRISKKIVSDIFGNNNSSVKRNLRFKTNRRYEIDLLAIKNNEIFAVDCKEWGKGRNKKVV